MTNYIDWRSQHGTYRYWFLDTPADAGSIKKEPGNYMFAKPTNQGWVPVYIGIADDLSARIPCHDRWGDAARAGATRVLAHTQFDAVKRAAEERDLIGYWQPVLNVQHRRSATGLGGLGS